MPMPMPMPNENAKAHSERLVDRIREEIEAAGGRLPFDRYMELALYAPGLGYYAAGARKFGEAGDFVTAPELSPLFARCLARQCKQVFEQLGGGDILEFGAGSGVMAADILLELKQFQSLPGRYLMLELSPALKARQRETLEQKVPDLLDRIEWLSAMPETDFQGVVLANELLDAMPVNRFRIERGKVLEQFVVWKEGQLNCEWFEPVAPGLIPAVGTVQNLLGSDCSDYESEVNLRIAPWLEAVSGIFSAGLLLLIDYGYPRAEFYHPQRDRGTLMCYYRHRVHPDPLFLPGLQDLTAHVDFTAVAEAGLAAGFSLAGYTTQTYFLMGTGLDELVAASDPNDVVPHMTLVQGVKRLTLPSEMGERFKALGLGKKLNGPLAGFSMREMSEHL